MTDTPDLALYEGGRKSLGLAYGLWFFLGLFGAHRFYTRAGKTGWIMLALHIGGWVLLAIAFYTHSETTTQSYETAFGVGSMTETTMHGGGGLLAVLGQAMRGAAWVWCRGWCAAGTPASPPVSACAPADYFASSASRDSQSLPRCAAATRGLP